MQDVWFRFWQLGASETGGFHLAGNMEQTKTCGSRRWFHGARDGNLSWLHTRMYGLGHWWLCNSFV